MSYIKIGDSNPKYLAATDILIGDMSGINYEFLLFDRPIILLANKWLRHNFPDIGIKTDIDSLEMSISTSIARPKDYARQRNNWLKKTMHLPDGKSSNRVIDTVLTYSKLANPFVLLLHGYDEVLKTHLDPLYEALKTRGINVVYAAIYNKKWNVHKDNLVCISAHNAFLEKIPFGYKVHIDHSVRGVGTGDYEHCLQSYMKNKYFPLVDLHITEGEVSNSETKKLLGPYHDRSVMVGYTKSDTLLKLNTQENKMSVYKELGFDPSKPLITYAPAGKYSYPSKQGASLSKETINKIKDIASRNDYNLLIKLKYHRSAIIWQAISKLRRYLPT